MDDCSLCALTRAYAGRVGVACDIHGLPCENEACQFIVLATVGAEGGRPKRFCSDSCRKAQSRHKPAPTPGISIVSVYPSAPLSAYPTPPGFTDKTEAVYVQ